MLVFIDVVTLTTWQIVDPFYRDIKIGLGKVNIIIWSRRDVTVESSYALQ